MGKQTAQATAHPNIAFIKYWGNRDHALRIPANDSLSMTLSGLTTTTSVTFDSALSSDQFVLNGTDPGPTARERVGAHLHLIRRETGEARFAHVESHNSFPAGAGIASSASAFAALTLAAAAAAQASLDVGTLSRLARQGSGSAARSLFGGYVQLHAADEEKACFAECIAPQDHWRLIDLIALVDREHKQTGSTSGHQSASSSPLQAARVADAHRRMQVCLTAILERDFARLAQVAELDSNMMHAVMLTSTPPLLYWSGATIAVMHRVEELRQDGLAVFYTVDAGPNVHCICTPTAAPEVLSALYEIPGVLDVLQSETGAPPALL